MEDPKDHDAGHEGERFWSLCRFVGGPLHGKERWVHGYPTTSAPISLRLEGCSYMRVPGGRGTRRDPTFYVPLQDHMVISRDGSPDSWAQLPDLVPSVEDGVVPDIGITPLPNPPHR